MWTLFWKLGLRDAVVHFSRLKESDCSSHFRAMIRARERATVKIEQSPPAGALWSIPETLAQGLLLTSL